MAFFVEKMSKEVLVADRGQVSIEPHGKVLIGSTLKATVKLREHKWEAKISPTAFEGFRDWKFTEEMDDYYREEEAEAAEREPQTGIRAKEDRPEGPATGIKRPRSGRGDNEETAES